MQRLALASAAALMIALSAPAAFADPAQPATTGSSTADAANPAPPTTTSSITGPESKAKKLADCMAIWDKRTHMTKAQWKRTCETELEPLPTP